MKVLVTGGSGLVGESIKSICNDYIFINSKDCDLRNLAHVDNLFEKYKPDIVLHLANLVAGLYGNMSNNYTMLTDNIKINIHILESCKKYNVKRLVNILSTCVFGNNLVYPLTSDQILNSPCDKSNEGYSSSKRILYTGSELLTDLCDIEVVNLIPTNLYGKNDNYDLNNAHVIPNIIHKIFLAKQNNEPLIIKGSGNSFRQFVFSEDFAKIIIKFVDLKLNKQFNTLIVGPSIKEEITIKQLVEKLTILFKFEGVIVYDTSYSDGQIKKTVDSVELLNYIPDFEFTELNTGLTETINYFIKNYNCVRK